MKLLIGAFFLFISGFVWAGTITTERIVTEVMSATSSCLDYQVIGECFWFSCGSHGCKTSTTPMVKHFLPDLVVSSYPSIGGSPWVEMRDTVDVALDESGEALYSALYGTDLSDGQTGKITYGQANVWLKEADVIGDPALSWFNQQGYLLHSQAREFWPYYESVANAIAWRNPMLDEVFHPEASWVPGVDEVGDAPLYTWGPLYPRTGINDNVNEPKTNGVVALRAANIATTADAYEIHDDVNLASCGSAHCTPPGEVTDHNSAVKWQRLSPEGEEHCESSIDTSSDPSWTFNSQENESYSWVVWRQYQGCLPGSGHYTGSVMW